MTKIELKNNDGVNINYNDIGSNRISFKQNSSGFWYTNELTINCISIMDGIELGENAIKKINKILEKVNNGKGKPDK